MTKRPQEIGTAPSPPVAQGGQRGRLGSVGCDTKGGMRGAASYGRGQGVAEGHQRGWAGGQRGSTVRLGSLRASSGKQLQ